MTASSSASAAAASAAAPAHELEQVGVALLRQHRGTGGQRGRQLHEAELRGREQAEVGGQPPEVLRQQRGLEQRAGLGLAARELDRGDRLVRRGEPQRPRRQGAVERQHRDAVAGGRAERVEVGASPGREQPGRVVAQLGGERPGPAGKRSRHRPLHVRVAGHDQRAPALGDRVERGGHAFRVAGERFQLVLQPQPQRGEHLVVARAAEVDAPARLPHRGRQPVLQGGVAVLLLERDPPLAARVRRADRRERALHGGVVALAQEPGGAQHLGVGRRSPHVVRDQPVVEGVVLAGGELEHEPVERFVAVPQPRHAALPSPRKPRQPSTSRS